MENTSPKFFVVGLTHIDLAWKKDREEHEEIMEAAVLRLLDILDRHPHYTYTLEQAAHFRVLAQKRPDLVARLRNYLQEGRLEFAGGLASTLETNGPSGESFVRNQLLGLSFIRETFGTPVRTGYLIDTFGVNAQVPQILRQFGFTRLLANRFGGVLNKDVFVAKGLDGTRILVAGRDSSAPFVAWERVFFGFVQENKHIKALFDRAAGVPGNGPLLVMPYTEYDGIASSYTDRLVTEHNAGQGGWAFATLSQFFDALPGLDTGWPEISADLNAEFTGTFGLRVAIRCLHRRAETSLLGAEKWAALLNLANWREKTRDLWWSLAFVQSHDVYTGSHPTSVYLATMAQLYLVEQGAHDLLARCVGELAVPGESSGMSLIAFNGLPWQRDAEVEVDLPDSVDVAKLTGVLDGAQECPFELDGKTLRLRTSFDGVEAKRLDLRLTGTVAPAKPPVDALQGQAEIGNGLLTVTADPTSGLRIQVKNLDGTPRQTLHVEIVMQEDRGSFQIEQFLGSEVSSNVGITHVVSPVVTALHQELVIAGRFPALWTGSPDPLDWEIKASLRPGQDRVDLSLRMDWHAVASRARLKVTTGYESSTGIFEIPFGAVRRQPYHTRRTARGEWPTHRWVAVEEGGNGVALINTGHVGAEVAGGAIWASLLRAPTSEYVGMVVDDTSSQHGVHNFVFSVLPYKGSWTEGKVIQAAQEVNDPVRCLVVSSGRHAGTGPLLRVDSPTVVLSGVKVPEDGIPDEVIVRLYEATGRLTEAKLFLHGALAAWASDLPESKGAPLACSPGEIPVTLAPFEIKTLRVQMAWDQSTRDRPL